AEIFHIDPIEIERRKEIVATEARLVGQSKEMTAAQKELADSTRETNVAWENLKNTIWEAIGPSSLAALTAFNKVLAATLNLLNDIIQKKPEGTTPLQRGYQEGAPALNFPAPQRTPAGQDPFNWLWGQLGIGPKAGPGTAQKFGAFGGADLGGLRLNENW